MIKIKFTTHAVNEFYAYLNLCIAQDLPTGSHTFCELLKIHVAEIQQTLQKKYLDLMHSGRARVSVKFTRAHRLVLSYLFKCVPVSHFLVPIEFKILEGL